ncbi:MAG: ABC transporter permease, partial [Phycisphaerales bacterium]|nr:ABC transporter permease [Phycisphaerales bacterium]
KPFDRQRFREALERARAHIRRAQAGELHARLLALLGDVRPAARRERLVVREGGRIFFLRAEEIDWIEAAGNYVRLHAGKRAHLLRETLAGLEEQLDPARFARVHRSAIVNLDRGFEQFRAIGQEGRLGGVINVSVTKQIGPVLAAVMVAGRVGGALAAELGTMRVTEQLDALRAMGADPIPYLVVPRFVACVIMTPLLTIYSDVLGVWGGWLITVQFYDVSPYEYWDFTRSFVTWWEPMTGLIKSVFFGGSIGLIACYKGFNCEAGAAGVGRAATEAFVASFLTIIALNLVLAKLLNTINSMFIYEGTRSAFG